MPSEPVARALSAVVNATAIESLEAALEGIARFVQRHLTS